MFSQRRPRPEPPAYNRRTPALQPRRLAVDTPLKQRLIGAIVLVALAVIFLPMLVKDPAPDSGGAQDVPLNIPAPPGINEAPPANPQARGDGQFETRELPLVAPNAPASGSATGMPEATIAPAAAEAGNALPPAMAAGDYAVNFGAYATQADADAVIAHLKNASLPGFRQSDTLNGRQVWRVRIGPYADRAQAELVRLEAGKVRSDVNAQVVVLNAAAEPQAPVAAATPAAPPPGAAAPSPEPAKPVAAAPKPEPKPQAPPATPKPETPKPALPERSTITVSTAPAAPAASSVGFAVQLGAFGKPADANALRDRVRAAGFSAFTEQVRTDSGVLHRVRVGPVANRNDAEQLKAQVASKIGISGMVRPHP